MCASHCLGITSSVVRPCLGPVGSGVSLYLGPCSQVCEILSMTLWTRLRVLAKYTASWITLFFDKTFKTLLTASEINSALELCANEVLH